MRILQSIWRIISHWFQCAHRGWEKDTIFFLFLCSSIRGDLVRKLFFKSTRKTWPYNRVLEVFVRMWPYTEDGVLIWGDRLLWGGGGENYNNCPLQRNRGRLIQRITFLMKVVFTSHAFDSSVCSSFPFDFRHVDTEEMFLDGLK